MRIALAGNPNAGKSTLFNALCGADAHTGNYAGVTVELREAPLPLAAVGRRRRRTGRTLDAGASNAVAPAETVRAPDAGARGNTLPPAQAEETTAAEKPGVRPRVAEGVTVVDLPGCYSLTARSADEDVAQRVLLGDLGEAPCDFVVCVVDALQLARGLYLVLQLRELGVPGLVVLNMADVARARGLEVDAGRLAARLGTPVVRCAARDGEGVEALRTALLQAASDAQAAQRRYGALQADVAHAAAPTPLRVAGPDAEGGAELPACPLDLTGEEQARLAPLVAALMATGRPSAPRPWGLALWLATSRLETLHLGLPATVRTACVGVQAALNPRGDGAFNRRVINARFAAVDALVREVRREALPPHPRDRALDDVLLHPVYGTVAFVATMFVLFQAVFAWAAPVMAGVGELVGLVAGGCHAVLPAGAFRSLLVDGVLVGAGNVLTFVPQVGLLFVGLGLLEQSGYMARAACLLDRPMRRVGLSGRAFIPLMSSFACAIPGILATRTMDARDGRLRTMLVAPLMSCSARLPVYTLVVAAVFAEVPPLAGVVQVGGLLILAMYLFGFVAALGTAWLLRRTVVPGPVPHLILALPDYRVPRPLPVLRQAARQCWGFVTGSGGTIVALSVVLWAALHFPRPTPPPAEALWAARAATVANAPARAFTPAEGEALQRAWALERSAAGAVGRALEPVLRPLGFDWRIGVGILASFAAREVLVSTLAQVYAAGATPNEGDAGAAGGAGATPLGAEAAPPTVAPLTGPAPVPELPTVATEAPAPRAPTLSAVLRAQRDAAGRPSFTPLVGLSLMVFFVLALQCSSTVAVLRRETGGWRWPLAAVAYMNGLAWCASFVVYQGGRALGLG